MKWDSRGLWYWIPAALLLGSFFVGQPAPLLLRLAAVVSAFGITVVLRRSDPTWGRPGKRDADGR